ncbi:MAG: diaminopimelate epimerase [Calditerrivibrio sp.]|nr:diaminopimelate epimerase [Calditerrivibrio sp.]
MNGVSFWKMSGSGNDFIIIDNRSLSIDKSNIRDTIGKICKRSLSIGADGVIFIEPSEIVDFKWDFYNSDGSNAEMCGNGARCAARFCYLNGITGKEIRFESLAGIIEAEITTGYNVKVKLTRPQDLILDKTISIENRDFFYSYVNTGVPHIVIQVDDLNDFDVKKYGRLLRFHENFSPKGTNVNFIKILPDNKIKIRTYERGVEDETLACGTGSAAAAYILYKKKVTPSPVNLITSGGMQLTIHLENETLFLEGEARVIYKGVIHEESYKY